MKNILFFTFNELKPDDGISKKIIYQKKAFEKLGFNVHLMNIEHNDKSLYSICINNHTIKSYSNKYLWLFKLYSFKSILNYVKDNDIKYIYVRYVHFASYSICKLFYELKKIGIKIVLEIPTYPYDKEYKTLKNKLFLNYDRIWRKLLAKNIDYIITFTQFKEIWGRPTIQIKNGLDFTEIKLKNETRPLKKRVELIAVATISFWHGFDRVIEGINIYNQSIDREFEIHFNIVGNGDITNLIKLVDKYNLNNSVTFCGPLYGNNLDDIFEIADIAIGCLGCHRKGIKEVSSLKNVEYAARGIPFIYSEINKDFDNSKFVKKIIPDDSPIDIEELIEWRKNFTMKPCDIRNSIISSMSWEKQMHKICTFLDM